MDGRRNLIVAREGMPFLVAATLATVLVWYALGWWAALPPALVFWGLYLLFRDPRRDIPSEPRAVVSPVDGTVVDVDATSEGVLDGQAHRIILRVNSLGTYTARSPVEGQALDIHTEARHRQPVPRYYGLWLRTDEGDDVVLQFHGHRLGLVPRAFARYGERLGQGQRCAYLRLTRFADVQLPAHSRILVTPGQSVSAGSSVLALLPHR